MKTVIVEQEYQRILALFDGIDEKQLALIDGAIRESARLRVELDRLSEIVAQTGLIKLHPTSPALQRELPVSRLIVKVRAGYINYISKLSGVLGRSADDEDDDLDEFI